MKKLNILLLSVVVMGSTFVSCTKEDVNPTDENHTEIGSNIVLTGKWNFSTVSEGGIAPMSYPAGWGKPETQCAGVPDYIDFKNGATVEYGDNDNDGGADCTLTKKPMSYSTTPSAVLINNLLGSGRNETFTLVSKTSTELKLKVSAKGETWIYLLTKAQE